MTTQEFESKRQSLIESHKAVLDQAKKRVEARINEFLGSEFSVLHFSENGFEISLMRDEKPVFGTSFDVRVDRDWLGTKEVKVEVNIGTCGSFEIGTGAKHDQEKKYVAFARFISMFDLWGLRTTLIKCYEDIKALEREYRKLKDAKDLITEEATY